MNQKGFTFVEIALALTILSILAVTAIPRDPGSQFVNLDAAAKKLQGDIRYAQNIAMTTGADHGIRRVSATSYQVYKVSTNAVISSPYSHTPMTENFTTSYNGVRITNAAFNIVFNVYGEPTTGGGTAIGLTLGSATKTISVTSTTGYVSVN